MLGIMLMLITVGAQASTIVLKDGREITGDIIQQDKTKVVVKDGDSTLTYYKEDIVSIDGEALIAEANDVAVDAEKEKLAQQYLAYFPMSQALSDWVESNVPLDKRQAVLSLLNNDKNMAALTKLRIQGVVQYFSSADLEAVIKFQSSAEGNQYFKDSIQYQKKIVAQKLSPLLRELAKTAK